MRAIKISLLVIVVIFISILTIGFILPKERLITEKVLIDKMYFFIVADITNHWEEPAWNNNVDTLIQIEQVDGLDAWKEYYVNGDSAMFLIQKIAETDYIRLYVDKSGRNRNCVITVVDIEGKTAVRMSEEIYEPNPLKRFYYLINDKKTERVKQYLTDLKQKSINDAASEQQDDGSEW